MNQLDEAFSSGSNLDIQSMRELYENRDVFLNFSNDHTISYPPQREDIPDGVVVYPVRDFIRRTVRPNLFYAHVFILKKNKFLDPSNYTKQQFDKDIDALFSMRDFKERTILDAVNFLDNLSSANNFKKIWELSKFVAKSKGSNYKSVWRDIFVEMGYDAILEIGNYSSVKETGAILYLTENNLHQIDIVPIQVNRENPTTRVQTLIQKRVTRWEPRRNGVAKIKFSHRGTKSKQSVFDLVKFYLQGAI